MTCLDSRKTLKLDPASTSTNRIDLIIARIYDDNNPAIGSPSGERKFTVEVWKGDASTGTPTRPIPTPAAGWIPLAEVKISAGVGAIAAADITDLRGPGLVARGGMRSLYGADADPSSAAFKEAGAYPGDQRWVHANGFQHQVFYGKSSDPLRGGWRGVHNCIVVNANPAPGELLWTKSTALPTEICRVKIPYPGTPFMVYATGRAVLTLSPDVKVDLRITIDSPTGTPVNWNTVSSLGIENAQDQKWRDTSHTVCVPPLMYGAFDRPIDLVLSGWLTGQLYTSYGWAYRGNDTGANLLSACVYPSTVAPPTS